MTGKQKKTLAALLASPTRAAAAETAGVSTSTVRRWLQTDTEFRSAYRDALDTLMQDAGTTAKRHMAQALEVLGEIMQDPDAGAQARIGASRTVLEFGLRLHEAVDVLDRLAALERRAGEGGIV